MRLCCCLLFMALTLSTTYTTQYNTVPYIQWMDGLDVSDSSTPVPDNHYPFINIHADMAGLQRLTGDSLCSSESTPPSTFLPICQCSDYGGHRCHRYFCLFLLPSTPPSPFMKGDYWIVLLHYIRSKWVSIRSGFGIISRYP